MRRDRRGGQAAARGQVRETGPRSERLTGRMAPVSPLVTSRRMWVAVCDRFSVEFGLWGGKGRRLCCEVRRRRLVLVVV